MTPQLGFLAWWHYKLSGRKGGWDRNSRSNAKYCWQDIEAKWLIEDRYVQANDFFRRSRLTAPSLREIHWTDLRTYSQVIVSIYLASSIFFWLIPYVTHGKHTHATFFSHPSVRSWTNSPMASRNYTSPLPLSNVQVLLLHPTFLPHPCSWQGKVRTCIAAPRGQPQLLPGASGFRRDGDLSASALGYFLAGLLGSYIAWSLGLPARDWHRPPNDGGKHSEVARPTAPADVIARPGLCKRSSQIGQGSVDTVMRLVTYVRTLARRLHVFSCHSFKSND